MADASLALVQKSESTPIAEHSIRGFQFPRLLAELAACVMHDLGLSTLAAGQHIPPTRRRPLCPGNAIVEHVARSQAVAPPYSIAAELLRQ
ncbi:hypothetical protein [Streptomyces sp. ME19-01-6]|uniref:hypothetical protein n=1 Tax=Streptomyces sp. ME19-01-6 TaxID=3028686 RepID=UPI0029A7ADA8|nr:hypothetical protein [Streptomyces sp. ME19-01-6]MDX3229195.1 hypothetical protein [Streptomyces sp. ME19-01-6]